MHSVNRVTLAVLVVGGLTAMLAAPASAFENPIIDFGTGYAKEGSRVADDHTSTADDSLFIVGHVVDFNSPFGDLDANDPTLEYTYVYSGLISQGTVVSGSGPTAVYDTDYDFGTLRIYSDPALDSDFADPATFMNGDMILEASLSNFHLTTLGINCSGNQSGDFQFTGGSLFDRVSSGGVGYPGIIAGLFSVCSNLIPQAQRDQGYFGLSDTKLDIDDSVPVEKRSWGQIKQGLR